MMDRKQEPRTVMGRTTGRCILRTARSMALGQVWPPWPMD